MIPHWKQKFVLLWTGQALSILSSMVSQYALIWYLTDLTGSPAVLSLATMAAMVPQGVLSLFTGAFAALSGHHGGHGAPGGALPVHRGLCRPL